MFFYEGGNAFNLLARSQRHKQCLLMSVNIYFVKFLGTFKLLVLLPFTKGNWIYEAANFHLIDTFLEAIMDFDRTYIHNFICSLNIPSYNSPI